MKNTKQVKMRIEADYKARNLFFSLMELADGDKTLLIEGMSVAFAVIKNDLMQLLPPPAPATLPPVQSTAPVVANEPGDKATEDDCVNEGVLEHSVVNT